MNNCRHIFKNIKSYFEIHKTKCFPVNFSVLLYSSTRAANRMYSTIVRSITLKQYNTKHYTACSKVVTLILHVNVVYYSLGKCY